MKRDRCGLYKAILFGTLATCGLQSQGHAEITLDGSLGPGGPLTGPQFQIPAAVGEQVGGNLFHSFGVFNINTGESATFTGPGGIDNVLGRVTGGSESTINGALNSTIPDADVYLINPAGVMFGENARLNVPGSFHVSTADYIRLGVNERFAATKLPSASTLTVAPPSAFGFLDNSVAPISMNGSNLVVPEGETFSILGGTISINSSAVVGALSGRINIASVASAGEVNLINSNLNIDSFSKLDEIAISQGATIGASGEAGGNISIRGGDLTIDKSLITAFTTGGGNGGAIDVQLGGDLVINQGIIGTGTKGSGNSGTIAIDAGTLMIRAGGINSSADEGSQGDAGQIVVDVGTLQLIGDSGAVLIDSSTFGSGRGGDIKILATTLSANGGRVTANTTDTGRGGDVAIEVGRIRLSGGAQIDSTALDAGRGGDIKIVASEGISIVGQGERDATEPTGIINNSNGTGAAGNLTIITQGPLAMRGGRILTRTLGGGNGGTLTVRARDVILIDGAQIFSGIGNETSDGDIEGIADGAGAGGNINITATDTLSISGGSGFGSAVSTQAQIGQGNAGTIVVRAGRLNISDGGRIDSDTSSEATGDAGIIIVTIDNLTIDTGGEISTESKTSGAAGKIELDVADTARLHNGSIRAASDKTSGGNIVLTAGSVQLTQGSAITSNVFGGPNTDGGNILIDGGSFVSLNDSQVNASALQGNGGRITINSDVFLRDAAVENVLIATGGTLGNDGVVEVNSPENDIAGSISKLPASFLNAAALLSRRCAARDADETSSFVIVGRGGVPRGPDDWALSSYIGAGTVSGTSDIPSRKQHTSSLDPNAYDKAPLAILKLSCARQASWRELSPL